MSVIEPFGEDIWTVEGDVVRLVAIPFATRMTVIRLQSGGLWVWSPVAPSEARCATVDALGRVEHLVAPNKIHSLGLEPWKQRYPDARVWVSPQFSKRHPSIAADGVLGESAPEAWRGVIGQLFFAGSKLLDEMIFCHHASRTLIVTDLIQRHDPTHEKWFWQLGKRVAGVLGESGGTAIDLRLSYRDRAAARQSVERILDWDFDRLIISHGLCVQQGAKDVVRRALAWAL